MKTALTSFVAITMAGGLVGGAVLFSGGSASVDNVSIVDGTQIIEITAKGGYRPKLTDAKAGVPTIVRVKTKGTYDCSASLKIPSAGFEQILPLSGTTDIAIAPQEIGATVQGLCAMGMYNFNIRFN